VYLPFSWYSVIVNTGSEKMVNGYNKGISTVFKYNWRDVVNATSLVGIEVTHHILYGEITVNW